MPVGLWLVGSVWDGALYDFGLSLVVYCLTGLLGTRRSWEWGGENSGFEKDSLQLWW